MNEKPLSPDIPIVTPIASPIEASVLPRKSSGGPDFVPMAALLGLAIFVSLAFLAKKVIDHKRHDAACGWSVSGAETVLMRS